MPKPKVPKRIHATFTHAERSYPGEPRHLALFADANNYNVRMIVWPAHIPALRAMLDQFEQQVEATHRFTVLHDTRVFGSTEPFVAGDIYTGTYKRLSNDTLILYTKERGSVMATDEDVRIEPVEQAQPEQSNDLATITVTIHLVNKVEMTYAEGFAYINKHFPFVATESRPAGIIRHEDGVVTIKLLQVALTGQQRHWLNSDIFSANYIGSYDVDPKPVKPIDEHYGEYLFTFLNDVPVTHISERRWTISAGTVYTGYYYENQVDGSLYIRTYEHDDLTLDPGDVRIEDTPLTIEDMDEIHEDETGTEALYRELQQAKDEMGI